MSNKHQHNGQTIHTRVKAEDETKVDQTTAPVNDEVKTEQAAHTAAPQITSDELVALLKLKAEVDAKKKKASEASKASRKARLEKATAEQKAEWKKKASEASKASNAKRKAEIAEMKAKLAKFESQQQAAA